MADDRLIVALDVSTMDAVKEIVLSLGDSVSFYKVGMELFYAEGAKTIRFLQEQNKQIFLDLKLHDIPNTVAHGVLAVQDSSSKLVNAVIANSFGRSTPSSLPLSRAASTAAFIMTGPRSPWRFFFNTSRC